MLDAAAPRLEHTRRLGGRRVDQLPLLLAAASPEAVGGGAALLVPPLDERASPTFGGHEPLALEDADGVAAHAHEQHRDPRLDVERIHSGPARTTSYSPSCSSPNSRVTVSTASSSSIRTAPSR